MAFSISCCNNLTPASESLHSSEHVLARPKSQKQRSRKYGCLLGAATLMVGLQIMSTDGGLMAKREALASEFNKVESVSERRWSDKRACPSWRVNSLETIVPENLPRPIARRSSEAVEFPKIASQFTSTTVIAAPAKCFSL